MGQPLSNKARSGISAWVFYAVAGVGLAILHFTFPIFKLIEARSWIATPCVIDSSSVARHTGSKGSTYSIEITYSYSVNGKPYAGSLYHFFPGSSSGYSYKAAVVQQYKRGSKAICYVNPHDPYESVIDRGITRDGWLGLIPLIFVVVGVWGGVASLRSARRSADSKWQPAALRHAADFQSMASGPRELKPSASPLGKLAFFIVFALFWNGIISLMLGEVFRSWRRSDPDWGMTLLAVPFVLVGIGMVLAALWHFLALFNPRAHLRINPGAVALGDKLAVEWTLHGRAAALSNLRITLEGSEAATYQNGKDTSTSTQTFFTVELVNSTDPTEFASGSVQAALPCASMHSLDTGHNKILWQLCVRGKIPRWPDLSEDYPLAVLPLRKGAA